MARPDPGLIKHHDALVRVLRTIDQFHDKERSAFFAQLASAKTNGGTVPRSTRLMSQAWRRWVSGAHLPTLPEAARIVALAKAKGWLSDLRDRSDNEFVKRLAKEGRVGPDDRNEVRRGRSEKRWEAQLAIHKMAMQAAILEEAGRKRLELLLPFVDKLVASIDPFSFRRNDVVDASAAIALGGVMTELVCLTVETLDKGPFLEGLNRTGFRGGLLA